MGLDKIFSNTDVSIESLINDIQFANRFKAFIIKPDIFPEELDNSIHIKSINLPNSNVGSEERNYTGIPFKIANSRIIDGINLSIYDKEGGILRDKFIEWHNQIYDLETGKRGYYKDYIGRILIYIYGFDGNVKNTYLFNEIWPTSIGDVTMSRDSSNTIVEFMVQLTVKNFNIIK